MCLFRKLNSDLKKEDRRILSSITEYVKKTIKLTSNDEIIFVLNECFEILETQVPGGNKAIIKADKAILAKISEISSDLSKGKKEPSEIIETIYDFKSEIIMRETKI